MIVFALNTAFAALDGAVMKDGALIAEAQMPLARGHEQHLPEFAVSLLREAKLGFDDITRFAIVTGPGSFTGIRVGVSYMRGLALVTGAPCIGVTALEAAVPDDARGAAIACLAAKKRPPDRTWWVQTLIDGEGAAPVEELFEADMVRRVSAFGGRCFVDSPEDIGLNLCSIELFVATAAIAAAKASRFDPSGHLPSPVYAREPDAKLPAPRR